MGSFADRYEESKRSRESQASGGNSIGGFLSNVAGDVGEMVTGLTALVGGGLHDVAHAATLGYVGDEFLADDMFKDATGYQGRTGLAPTFDLRKSSIVQDYVSKDTGRYNGWDNFLRGLYEDPLMFAADAATVATAGGAGAARGAQIAAKTGGAADDLARLGAGASASDVGRVARVADKILPGLKAGPGTPQGGMRTRVDALGRVETSPAAFNPVRRAVQDRAVRRLTTEPLHAVERRLGALKAELDDGGLDGVSRERVLNDVSALERTVSAARGSEMARVEIPKLTDFKARRGAAKIFGHGGTQFIHDRNQTIGKLSHIFKRSGLDQQTVEDFHRIAQWDTPESAGRLSFDDAARLLDDPLSDPRMTELAETIRPDIERIRKLEGEGGDALEIDAGKRYVEHLTEAVVTPDDAPRVAHAMDDVRLLMHRELTTPALERGMLSYQSVLGRMYLPGRIKNFGARWNVELGDFEGGPSPFELDDALRKSGRKAPLYFPHIDARRLTLSDWLMSWRARGGIRTAEPKGLKRSLGYLLDNDLYLKDPLEAYARRASQMSRYLETMTVLERVAERYGRKISSADELSSTERYFSPNVTRMTFKHRMKVEEAIADRVMDGSPIDESFGTAIMESLPDIENAAAGELLNQGDVFAIPKVVADELEKFAKPRMGGWKVRLFWDAPTNVWRSLVLSGSPRWIVNNLIGNTVFLKAQGGKVADVVRQGISPRFRKQLKAIIPEGVEGGFFADPQHYVSHLGAVTNTAPGQAVQLAKQTKALRAASIAANGVRRLNTVVEDAYRRASYIKAAERQASQAGIRRTGGAFIKAHKRLERVAEVGADPQLVARALDEVNEWLNDYGSLTPFERNVVRRFAMPFYSFHKHVTLLLLKMPFKHPEKQALLQNLAAVGNEFSEESGPKPEWMAGSIALGPGLLEGTTEFLNPQSANPFTAVYGSEVNSVGDVIANAAGSLHPAVKIGIEQATGKSLLTGRDFTAPGVYRNPATGQTFRINPETGEPEPYDVQPSILEHFLRQIPQVELFRDLRSDGARYSAVDEVIRDGETPRYPTNPGQEALRFLGVPLIDYDVGTYQDRLSEDQLRALRALSGSQP